MSKLSNALELVNEFCYKYYLGSREDGFALPIGEFSDDIESVSYDNHYINLPVNEYGKKGYGYVYQDGKYFLFSLSKAMGEEGFFGMLSNWYSDKNGSIATGGDFIDTVLSVNSSDAVKDIINAFICANYV